MMARRLASAVFAGMILAGSANAADRPARLISLGPGVTEITYALGAGPALVAVDSTSIFPAAASRLPQLGYVRTLGAEGIAALGPDLVLAGPEAGPPDILTQLGKAGIKLTRLPDADGIESLVDRIRKIGQALGRDAEADRLATAVQDDLIHLRQALAGRQPVPALFVLSAGRGAPMAAGRGTVADTMLTLAGGRNVMAEDVSGYRPVSIEAASQRAPSVLVTTSHTVDAMGGLDRMLALPELAALPPVRNRRVLVLDTQYLLGLGPRTAHAARDLAAGLHGTDAVPTLPPRPWLEAGS